MFCARLIIFVFLSSVVFVPRTVANSQIYDVNMVEPGGLYFATAKPGRVVRAPVLSTDIEMTINGPLVHTRIVQRFTNTSRFWVEGIYTYPLPKGSAVDTLEIQVGGKITVGEIKEKQQARKIFEQAKVEGKRASIVIQKRPNIFTTRLANIGPGETIKIAIEYQDLIEPRDNQFQLRFPMVVRPRYNPGIPLNDRHVRSGWGFDTDEVPDGSSITPPYDINTNNHNLVSLHLTLNAGFDIGALASPSHDIDIDLRQQSARISLVQGSVPADQDFILRWAPKFSSVPQLGVFHEETESGQHQLLMLLPPTQNVDDNLVLPREFIVVLDKSGSMSGQAIRQAKSAVRRALIRLKKKDKFNLLAFDNTTTPLFQASQPVTDRTIASALDFIDTIEAGGGTEMSSALTLAFGENSEKAYLDNPQQETSQYLKQIIFVTDGAVGNEAALMAQIKTSLGDARLFTVGIGSAPNSYFMSEAAHFGRGTNRNIGMNENVLDAMAELFSKIEQPQLTDISLTGLTGNSDIIPTFVPDLYDGEPIIIVIKNQETSKDSITVNGWRIGKLWSNTVSKSIGRKADGVAKLWARRKIQAVNRSYVGKGRETIEERRESVLKVALEYGLVSDFTSLVAVEQKVSRQNAEPLFTRDIPANMPAGMQRPSFHSLTHGEQWLRDVTNISGVRARPTATPMLLYIISGLVLLVFASILFWLTKRRGNTSYDCC